LARKLVQITNGAEAVQDGRIHFRADQHAFAQRWRYTAPVSNTRFPPKGKSLPTLTSEQIVRRYSLRHACFTPRQPEAQAENYAAGFGAASVCYF